MINNKIKIIASDKNYIMRTWSVNDALFFFELNSDHEVLQYTGDVAFESLDHTITFIENYNQFEDYGCGRWIIEDRKTQNRMGWCGLKYHPETREYDLGYRLMKRYWNKGIASQASLMILDFAIYGLRLTQIYAEAMKENLASHRVLEKIGFIKSAEVLKNDKLWWRFELKI